MVPGKYDITIYKGGTFEIAIGATNAALVETDFETVYDSLRLQIRPPWVKNPVSSTEPLLELTTVNGGIVVDGTTITLFISAADTSALTFHSGKYCLEMVIDATTDPIVAERVDPILYGKVTVIGEQTL